MGLDVDYPDEDLIEKSELFRSLVQGCKGALMRGPVKGQPLSNMHCHVIAVQAENGLTGLLALPGALRAAAIDAISNLLSKHRGTSCTVLEPKMTIEITVPNEMVGTVLSDLTNRRGTINEVVLGEVLRSKGHAKALILGDVPLVEILGYANILRSITAGEGVFTAEYKGHSPTNN
jgi:elongation factor G